ncbi:9552_t:CDS:2 [Acaulospora colombiana]|uniref:9552_t:CDS:1 n=1 Tax=Acaulospora colombiana TaxID=27376 RepID=A0ACA9M7T3_9GLOM|nr:9552_t:CDS:2 [Acaulospora colombiana]
MDYDELISKILDTHVLGEYVGAAWSLEKIMRWVPSHTNDPSRTFWSSGLYRVRGTAVEAVVGAASSLPISDSIREAMADASKAYGGSEANLTRSSRKELHRTTDRPISVEKSLQMPIGEFGYTGAKKPFPSGPPRLPPPKNSIRRLKSRQEFATGNS